MTDDTYGRGDLMSVSGASARQLDYWVEQGLLNPSEGPQPTRPRRIYSRHDLVKACVIAELRKARLTLDAIGRVLAAVEERSDGDYTQPLYVTAHGVFSQTEFTSTVLERVSDASGQLALGVVILGEVETVIRDRLGE